LQETFQNDCGRCYPVVTTKGEVHACPFAVEIRDPRFHLGEVAGDARRAVRNFEAFFRWIDDALMPYARAHGLQPRAADGAGATPAGQQRLQPAEELEEAQAAARSGGSRLRSSVRTPCATQPSVVWWCQPR
jgi:hypothetical protein